MIDLSLGQTSLHAMPFKEIEEPGIRLELGTDTDFHQPVILVMEFAQRIF